MVKTPKEIAQELKDNVEEAILCGPMRQAIERIEVSLEILERQIKLYIESEISRRQTKSDQNETK